MEEPEQGESRTILGNFLRLKMNGVDRRIRRKKSLKERLGLKGMGCCGTTWGGFRPTTMEDEDQEQEHHREESPREGVEVRENRVMEIIDLGETPADPDCLVVIPAGSGMNLAAALAAERQFRSSNEAEESREPLMRLLEKTTTDGGDEAETEEKMGSDMVCCVCMGRKKGAAFIPCGHTFCRVCSREVWLNRGTCPICNRTILEILDIF